MLIEIFYGLVCVLAVCVVLECVCPSRPHIEANLKALTEAEAISSVELYK